MNEELADSNAEVLVGVRDAPCQGRGRPWRRVGCARDESLDMPVVK